MNLMFIRGTFFILKADIYSNWEDKNLLCQLLCQNTYTQSAGIQDVAAFDFSTVHSKTCLVIVGMQFSGRKCY